MLSIVMFWSALGVIFYAYLGYPLLLALLTLFVRRPVEKAGIEPAVTLLITAYNEARDIEAKLENSLALDYPRECLDILVASDGSTDDTDRLVRAFMEKHPELSLRLHRVEGRVGKTATQNSAVRVARGEIIVFSDAAAMYEPGAIRALVANYADPKVGAVSGIYTYGHRASEAVGGATAVFWTLENFIKSCQTKIHTITGCCGCIYSLRRVLYVPLPAGIISDLVEPLMILRRGYRIVFETGARAVEMTAGRSRDEFLMRIRVIVRGMKGMLFVRQLYNPCQWPYIAWQLFSHKVVRWLVPIFALMLFISSYTLGLHSPGYELCFWLQLGLYGAAGWGLVFEYFGVRVGILYLPLYFCIVNAASLLGMIMVASGKEIVIWQTKREEVS